MKNIYLTLARVPRWALIAGTLGVYLLMLGLGAVEPASRGLPGRANYSSFYHLTFYFGLGGLLWFSMRSASILRVTCLVAVAGALDELHQYFLPFRQARLSDMMLDIAAGLTAALVLHYLRNLTTTSRTA